MAQPTVRAVGTVGQNAGSGNPTAPGIPAGTTTDDIMVLVVAAADNVTVTLPAGWTKFVEQNNGVNQRLTIGWKRAGSSESAPTVTHAAGNSASAVIVSVQNVPGSQANPIAVLGTPSANTSSTTVTATGITPAGATDLIFWAGLSTAVGTSNPNAFSLVGGTDPTFTERADNANGLGSNECDFAVDTGPSITGAATGTRTSTLSVAATVNTAVMFTLNDAGATVSSPNPLLAMLRQGGLQRAKALLLLHPPQVVAPASYSQALTATVTSTATLQNQVGKVVTATATSPATLIKSVGKTLTATVTGTASLAALKVVLKTLTATSTTTATVVKQVGKPLSKTVTGTATLIRQVGKPLTVTVTATATMTAMKVILKTLTATLTATASMARQVGKPLSVTVTATASVVKQVGKLLTKTVTATASLSALKVTLKTLTATVIATATMTRRVGLTVSATATVAASVTKRIGKTITGLVSGLASLVGIRVGPDTADPNPLRVIFTESGSVTFREPRSLSHVEPARTVTHTETGSLAVIEQGSIVHRDRR